MNFVRYDSAEGFRNDCFDSLMEFEIQNNLMLDAICSKSANSKNWFMASVKDKNGSVVLCGICTPPYNFLPFAVKNILSEKAFEIMADELTGSGFHIPGVVAAKETSRLFVEKYANPKGISSKLNLSLNCMQLDELSDYKKTCGNFRYATENDLFFLPHWKFSFNIDCKIETTTVQESYDFLTQKISEGKIFLWEDEGHPVSLCANNRSTVNGSVISMVYTPPYFRNKGYSLNCVGEASKLLMQNGAKFCALFADTANPVSNKVYNKLGYRTVCVFDEYIFNK